VDRDDLKEDFGSAIWSQTVQLIHQHVPGCSVEVLTPDFQGYEPALRIVFESRPEIFSHNVECIERISRIVRPQSDWQLTKNVLKASVDYGLLTKTGMMVGLGENDDEVIELMREISDLGVKIFNVGQYLQPTKNHIPVQRFVHPDTFTQYHQKGLECGFTVVEAGPLVRSSYHADEQAQLHNAAESI